MAGKRISDRSKRIVEMAQNYYTVSEEEFSDNASDPFATESEDYPEYTPSDESSSSNESVFFQQTQHTVLSNANRNINDNVSPIAQSSHQKEEIPASVRKDQDEEWSDPVGNHLQFDFDCDNGITPEYAAALVDAPPIDFWSVFVDNKIISEMVHQTNLYATQVLLENADVPSSSRLHKWIPTSNDEMKKFLGVICYIGMVNMPSIRHYWSNKPLFHIRPISEALSRNRFELLLKMWHFSDNNNCPEGDRLFKIQPLLDMFIQNSQKVFTPGQVVCIDETLVPFRGRLVMKQYIPQKTHKYGVKLFKLCCDRGYTWNLKVYAGKEADGGLSVPTKIVTSLAENLLDSGRVIITDNYYTSLELANILLDRKTHLIGTLRSNRRGNPRNIIQKKLKKGEIIGKENNHGVCIMKWRDKRDVLLLSTKNTHETKEVQRKGETIHKPVAILEYNSGKSSIDISDQMASYSKVLRKTIKWYRKLAIEILFGTAMVNAHFLYKKCTGSNMSITDFREKVLEDLLRPNTDLEPNAENLHRKTKRNTHTFAKKEGPAAKVRKYCRLCYRNKDLNNVTKNKVKKVTTYCLDCDNQPHYCLECFAESHK